MRRRLVLAAACLLSAIRPTAQSVPPSSIVLIVTDDQRADTLGDMPLVNALLGSHGVTFSKAIATSGTCCTTRASILTGLYVHHHGLTGNFGASGGGAPGFQASGRDNHTIAPALQTAGYRTALLGKYLNDYDWIAPYQPLGWNEWHAFLRPKYHKYQLVENGVIGPTTATYSTTKLAQLAETFIGSTPSDQPLFLYLAPYAPHTPQPESSADLTPFRDAPPYRPPSFNTVDASQPAWLQRRAPLTATQIAAIDNFRLRQRAALQSADRMVERVVTALQAAGRLENAVIIFTSDQGIHWGEHRISLKKNTAYEETSRVPLIIRAPGLTARTDTRLVGNIDLAPTILDYAGATATDPMDGVSLRPLLEQTVTTWRTEILMEVLRGTTGPGFRAVRTADDRIYIEYPTGEREYYNLASDPYHLTNAYATADPAVIADLQARLAILKQ